MNQNELAYFQQKLLQEQQKLQATAAAFEKRGIHENMNDVSGELSAYDQHPADYGSQMFEREKDYGLFENTHHELKKVQNALERLDAGLYGICEHCQQPIDVERLAALPAATLCIPCKAKEEEQQAPEVSTQDLSFEHTKDK